MYVLHICRIICYVTLLTYLFTDNIADRHLKVFLSEFYTMDVRNISGHSQANVPTSDVEKWICTELELY